MQQGICLLRDEKYDEAINKFDNVLKLDEKNPKAYIGKGQALFGANRIDESIEEYDKALGIEPNNKNALISKANSLMKNDRKDEALELYKKGNEIEDGKDNCIHLMNYALCLFDKRDLKESMNVLDRAKRCYEEQKEQLSQKERDFFEESLNKITKESEKKAD